MEKYTEQALIEARETLLDAVDALGTHGEAVILAEAQARYAHIAAWATDFSAFSLHIRR